jgi:DNA-binding NarL/FixJ family response regulator
VTVAPTQTRTLQILVAEDSRDIQQMMWMTLQLGGFEVVGQAYDGRETLELVRKLQPDILLLDLHMPEVGGLEVLLEIPAIAPRCNVVVHSAIGAMSATDAALLGGAVAYIEKGVSPRSIVAHLNRVAGAGKMRPVRPYPLKREYPDDC